MIRYIPLFLCSVLLAMLALFIVGQRPEPNRRIERPLPEFSLPLLYEEGVLTKADVMGQYRMVNVFASWCVICRLENSHLEEIAERYDVPLIGVAWKDKPENTRQWLENLGNHYDIVASDYRGELVVPLGITGTPESYLVNPEGVVVWRQAGLMSVDMFEDEVWPIITERPVQR